MLSAMVSHPPQGQAIMGSAPHVSAAQKKITSIIWPNASSFVTLASNGSDMGLFLLLRELHASIILWQEAPKCDMEERTHLSQGALSLARALAHGHGRDWENIL